MLKINMAIGVQKTIVSVNYNCRPELGAQRHLWVCGIIDLIVSTCSMSREIYYRGRNSHIFQGHNIGPFYAHAAYMGYGPQELERFWNL